jgi:hypothetical protein
MAFHEVIYVFDSQIEPQVPAFAGRTLLLPLRRLGWRSLRAAAARSQSGVLLGVTPCPLRGAAPPPRVPRQDFVLTTRGWPGGYSGGRGSSVRVLRAIPTRSACSPPALSMSLLSSGRCSTPEPCVWNRNPCAKFVLCGWGLDGHPVGGG